MSGKLWEQRRKRRYFLSGGRPRRSMQRIRQRVKELTPRSRCHADLRDVIAELNPVTVVSPASLAACSCKSGGMRVRGGNGFLARGFGTCA